MVKLILKSLSQHIKCELEYKVSFILGFISNILIFFTYYFTILALFSKFSNVDGFTKYEILLCFGIVQFGFAFNETFIRGIDKFEDFVIDGSLDRFFLRPRNILFQVIISKMHLVKISRVIQSIILIIVALINLKINISISKIITLVLMIISSVIIFFSLFLLAASYCFLSVHGLEVKNLLTDGSKNVAKYPIGIFNREFRIFYTYIVPFAVVNYYPLMFFLGKTNNMFYMFSPLLVIIFLILNILLFNYGLKHYSSVGS